MGSRENLERLYDLLDKQIDKVVAKNDITPNELESMYKSVCVMDKIEKMMYGEGGYSETGYSYEWPVYDRYPMSGNRGRSPMTGRYVSREARPNRGMSGHSIKDRMISKLEQMMDETSSEYEKEEITKYIHSLEASK